MNFSTFPRILTKTAPLFALSGAILSLVLSLSCAHAAPAKSGWDLLPDILARIVPPTFPARDFNITDYGAVGDGVTDCNPAFRKAIEACTNAGGGRVVVPKGTFLTHGPIHLDNNVNLHVTQNAKVLFSTKFEDYLPHVKVRWEGTECYNYSPFVYAYQKTNIAITGTGELNAQAESTWSLWPGKTKPGTISNENLRKLNHSEVPADQIKIYAKPTMIEPYECKNVLIEGVTLKDYPFWCVHPTFSTNVTIRQLSVISHNSNNDGINPDSCTDVLIEDCFLDQSDDCLAIKAGRDNSAWRAGKPCQNIVIRNMPPNFEGIAIGSEISGGVRNVFVYDCKYERGNVLYCKSNLDRGGFIKDIYVKDLEVGSARILRLRNNYHGYRGGNFPTEFRNINIENVKIRQGSDETISLAGVEEAPVYDVFLKNVSVETAPPPHLQVRHAENVVLTNVSIAGKIQPTHPPLLPPEKKELAGTASIGPRRSGLWSDVSNWATGRDGSGATWTGEAAERLPDGKIDKRVLVGMSLETLAGVTLIVDQDVDGTFELRIYENSTLVIPAGRTLTVSRDFRPDRRHSMVRQIGGNVIAKRNLQMDDESCQYLISGGSLNVGTLSLDEGTFIVDDRRGDVKSISVSGEFRTHKGNGNTTTKFVANKKGVTPIQAKNIVLKSYMGENLVVDVSAYDHTNYGDLVLFSYTGTREGEFDGGPESPAARVTILGGSAELVYDDAEKTIKLTNFRPQS